MFSLRRKEKSLRPHALRLYKAAMDAARLPVFYKTLGVPDTMDGRFDLLMLHVFLILNRLNADKPESDELAQALFDICFEDIDQALRESGVGDMKIAKHMKKMMLAFNGRMHAYDTALNAGKKALAEVLARNLYGTLEKPDAKHIAAMSAYMQDSAKALATHDMLNPPKTLFSLKPKKV